MRTLTGIDLLLLKMIEDQIANLGPLLTECSRDPASTLLWKEVGASMGNLTKLNYRLSELIQESK